MELGDWKNAIHSRGLVNWQVEARQGDGKIQDNVARHQAIEDSAREDERLIFESATSTSKPVVHSSILMAKDLSEETIP